MGHTPTTDVDSDQWPDEQTVHPHLAHIPIRRDCRQNLLSWPRRY